MKSAKLSDRPGKSGEVLVVGPDHPEWVPPALSFSVRGIAFPFTRVVPGRDGAAHEHKDYRHWKSLVIDAAAAEVARVGWKTAAGAVKLDVELVLVKRPTKRPRKSRADAHPIVAKSVGDIDNLSKGLMDGMERAGVYANDAQAVELVARKRWQRSGEDFAGAIVRVEIVA